MGPRRLALLHPAAMAAVSLWLFGCGEAAAPDGPEPSAVLADGGSPDGAEALPSAIDDDPPPPMDLPEVPTATDEPCRAGETRCLDEAVAQRCLRDGTWADLPCERNEECVPGPDRCLPVACEPGKSRCDGRWAHQACAATGRSWMLSEACDDTQQCLGGLCRVCQPNQPQCVSANTRRFCSPDGTEWLPPVACETNLCLSGECLVCVPGEGQCIDDTSVRVCRADGMGLEPVEVCPPDTACRGGRCLDRCRTRTMVLVDDSQAMRPYVDILRSVLAEFAESEQFEMGFMSTRPANGCGSGVVPPQVPFRAGTEDAMDWLQGLDADGPSQITDISTWINQNRRVVWGGDDVGFLLILTASGDTCGPEGASGRVNWNMGTYESLGGPLRTNGVRLKTINVGGMMDPQLNRLSVCNGSGSAIDIADPDTLEDDLRAEIRRILRAVDVCDFNLDP